MSASINTLFKTRSGKQLYQLLPEIYRSSDVNTGDLANYLDGFGELFDAIKLLLDQRLADAFPDNPDTDIIDPNDSGQGRACQEWLIPYFAQLVNAKLLSPTPEGKRDEVTSAVVWRQSKGTLVVAEQIAEAVGQFEAELHEGWQRVAMTARTDLPVTSAVLLGYSEDAFPEEVLRAQPRQRARHPGISGGTVDLRWPGQAVVSNSNNPASRYSVFAGRSTCWRQLNPLGAPAHANSFDDVSKRTVDIRNPNWQHGHFHPRRLLVYVPVENGLVPLPIKHVQAEDNLADYLTVRIDQVGEISYTMEIVPVSNHPVVVQRNITLPDTLPELLSGFDTHTQDAVINQGVSHYTIRDIQFNQTLKIDSGKIQLNNCIVHTLDVNTSGSDKDDSVAEISDSLLVTAEVNGLTAIDRSTILGDLRCDGLTAVDSIFNGNIVNFLDTRPETHADYCCIDATVAMEIKDVDGSYLGSSNTTETPQFLSEIINGMGEGVLSPACPKCIYSGASDGGELGFRNRLKTKAQVIEGDYSFTFPEGYDYCYRNLVFSGSLTVTEDSEAQLSLDQVAVYQLTVLTQRLNHPALNQTGDESDSGSAPVLEAKNCLFEELTMGMGVARLEYCTVLRDYIKGEDASPILQLQASDCIFTTESFDTVSPLDCIRYSRIPESVKKLESSVSGIRFPHCTSEIPTFFSCAINSALSGDIGCGVLHPSASDALCFGAEDGGEMGAFHDRYFCLKNQAVLTKLSDHLPMGIKPVLIFDKQLNHYPITVCPITSDTKLTGDL